MADPGENNDDAFAALVRFGESILNRATVPSPASSLNETTAVTILSPASSLNEATSATAVSPAPQPERGDRVSISAWIRGVPSSAAPPTSFSATSTHREASFFSAASEVGQLPSSRVTSLGRRRYPSPNPAIRQLDLLELEEGAVAATTGTSLAGPSPNAQREASRVREYSLLQGPPDRPDAAVPHWTRCIVPHLVCILVILAIGALIIVSRGGIEVERGNHTTGEKVPKIFHNNTHLPLPRHFNQTKTIVHIGAGMTQIPSLTEQIVAVESAVLKFNSALTDISKSPNEHRDSLISQLDSLYSQLSRLEDIYQDLRKAYQDHLATIEYRLKTLQMSAFQKYLAQVSPEMNLYWTRLNLMERWWVPYVEQREQKKRMDSTVGCLGTDLDRLREIKQIAERNRDDLVKCRLAPATADAKKGYPTGRPTDSLNSRARGNVP